MLERSVGRIRSTRRAMPAIVLLLLLTRGKTSTPDEKIPLSSEDSFFHQSERVTPTMAVQAKVPPMTPALL